MAAPSSTTFNWDQISSLTERRALPKITDNIFRSNVLTMKLLPNGTKLDGGLMIAQHLIYGEGPGGPFEGVEILNTSESEIITQALYNWKHYYASATIRRMDELKNSGKAAFARLLTSKLRVMERSMKNHLGNGIFSDGSLSKNITGLRAMVTDNVFYGNISKTLNTWWQSKVKDMTGTKLSLQEMRTLRGRVTEDRDTTDLIVTTQTVYNLFYNLLEPAKRYANESIASAGFKNVLYEGVPVVVDSHCPDGYMYFLNTDYIDFVTHEDENMRFEGWVKPHNQQARSAFIFWAGNLTCSNCRFQGVMTNVTE